MQVGIRRFASRSLALAATLLAVPGVASALPIRTLLVGDSITYGIVSGSGGTPYATLLADDLAGTHEVVNIGRSGLSAVYWAPSTPCPGICTDADTVFDQYAVPELPAQIATVLLGTNDALGFFLPEPTPVADWEGYMRELLDGLFAGGVQTIILMSPPDANLSSAAASLVHGYHERVNEICADTAGVLCGPDLANLLDPATDFAGTDIHPNALGHAKIADALAPLILAVPEPSTRLLLLLGLMVGAACPPSATRARRSSHR